MSTKFLLTLSVGLMLYGSVEVWLSLDPAKLDEKRPWCDAFLCPDEFSEQRIFDLIQKTVGDQTPVAMVDLRRALVLDPASAYIWADLGEAEMNYKNVEKARYCFRRAVTAGPRNPYILFRAANFDFQTGDPHGTLRLLRTVLADTGLTSYYDPTFLTYSRLDLPVEKVLEEGMPPIQAPAIAFLRYWMDSNSLAESQATWQWITQHGLANDQAASDYVAFLLKNKALEEAADAWKSYTAKEEPGYRKTNWIYNGDFAREPTSSPLDWHIERTTDAEVSRSATAGKDGRPALKVNFLGKENIDYRNVSQTLIVGPGRWKLSIWVKTEGISTDEGIYFHLTGVQDARKLDWKSRPLLGNTEWTCLEASFVTDQKETLVKFDLGRSPSRKFDNKIRGTAWITSIQVAPVTF